MPSFSDALAYLVLTDVPPDLQAWVTSQSTWEDAWKDCERPDWLIFMATSAGIDRVQLVAVACDCIERASSGRNLHEAWGLAKQWSRGQIDGRTCWAAGFRATSDAKSLSETEAPSAHAAASVAFACDDEADDGYYASKAHAAEAVRWVAEASSPALRTQLAAHIRRRVDGDEVRDRLEGLANKKTVPPPEMDAEVERPVTPRTLFRLRRA